MKSSALSHDPSGLHERLLDSAETVVAREGVSQLTLDKVARQAGVSKGGLLYHFHSKSDLVKAIVERMASRCDLAHAEAASADQLTPGRFTRAYLEARADLPDPKREPIHTALLVAAGTDPQYLDPFRRRMTKWQRQIESDGIDPILATIVRFAIDGMCLDKILGLPVPEDDFRRAVIEKLMELTRPIVKTTTTVERCGKKRTAINPND